MSVQCQNYLSHYGIKNQKWGVRRFQNEDGSYTAEGKERYGRGGEKRSKKDRSSGKGVMKGLNNKRDWKPEDAEKLSDDELNKRNSRLQRENQYRDMTTPKWKKEVKQTSKDWAKEAAKKIFIGTAVTLAVVAMKKNYQEVGPFLKKASNLAVNSLSTKRDAIKNVASAYSKNSGRKSSNRQYNYNPGSRNGFGSPKEFPSMDRKYVNKYLAPKKKR